MSIILGVGFFVVLFVVAALIGVRRAGVVPGRQRAAEVMAAPRVPGGVFIDRSHTWLGLRRDGTLRLGIDDLIAGVVGQVERVHLPQQGQQLRRGEPMLTIGAGERELTLRSPVDGEVVGVNTELESSPWLIAEDPYGLGWAVKVWSRDQQGAIQPLQLGATAMGFLRRELQRLVDFLTRAAAGDGAPVLADGAAPRRGALGQLEPERWQDFQRAFLDPSPRD